MPLRILIADDHAEAADTLAAGLALFGHDVRVAYDGEAALATLDHFEADVAILDLMMPRLGGYAVARRIRADRPERPVWLIALSGRAQPADRWDSSAAGFDVHLAKPAAMEEIEASIAAHQRALEAADDRARDDQAAAGQAAAGLVAEDQAAGDQQEKLPPHLSSGNSPRARPSVASRRN